MELRLGNRRSVNIDMFIPTLDIASSVSNFQSFSPEHINLNILPTFFGRFPSIHDSSSTKHYGGFEKGLKKRKKFMQINVPWFTYHANVGSRAKNTDKYGFLKTRL